MSSEFNKTRAAAEKGSKSRYTKFRPEICNLHLLWKALGPIVLRRRKQDIGQSIVDKVRHVYRMPMGLYQRATYRYNLESRYVDCNLRLAPGAKLQALRVASAAPDSHLLDPQAGGDCRVCCHQDTHKPDPETGLCQICGSPPLVHRSPFSYTPKVACALTLIRDILTKGEQAAVFSAFNDSSDILSSYISGPGRDRSLPPRWPHQSGQAWPAERGLQSGRMPDHTGRDRQHG
jgi:hypothetical protein